jgi:hypothetical protein
MSALENVAPRVARPDVSCTMWSPVSQATLGMCVPAVVCVRTVGG